MKKFFAAVIIAGALTACNNSGESTTNADTTNQTTDTTSMPATDTGTHKMDTIMVMDSNITHSHDSSNAHK